MFELTDEIGTKNLGSSSGSFQRDNQKLDPKNIGYHGTQIVKSHSNRGSMQEIHENTSFYQIASLIPDEILSNSGDYSPRKFEAVVLFADISGFTDLSEKYQNLENGASKLSAVLNFYLGIMVQEILSHNGDIIKYAGDAFLAVFRNEKRISMQNSVHNAIDTALVIQKSCRNYLTEVGIVLNVKIAISCGLVDFQIIGDEISSYYVIIGDPVWQVKALQEFIQPGEILVTWKAWYYSQESFYTYQTIKEHRCYKITGFKEQISLLRRQYEATLNFQEMQKALNKSLDLKSASNIFLESTFSSSHFLTSQNEIFSLRKKIGMITSFEARRDLRRFIITPVLNAVDMGDDIDSLTEVRHIVTVFVNIIVAFKDSLSILSITNRIYKKLFAIVNSYEGVVNKVSLFDKDMMFLNVFGLKGLQHENESEVGLKCACELYSTLCTWKDIRTVSIGVTTGKSYCGAVGHALRREYSVISISVNKAARLMIAYPNCVSCDRETLITSKINLNSFTLLPQIKLKGLSELIAAYKIHEISESTENVLDSNYNEILYGRNDILHQIIVDIAKAINNYNNHVEYKQDNKLCLLIRGESGEGKSKIINHLFRTILEQKIKCLKLQLNTKHSTIPYWMLQSFMVKIIETEYNSLADFERNITVLFHQNNICQYMFLLNEIIGVNFDKADNIELQHDEELKIELQTLMITIIFQSFKNFWIIFADNAIYIDSCSIQFINSIMSSQKACFIFATGKNHKKWSLQHGKFIKNEHVTQYNLRPIDKTFQKDIACQSINVSAIPIEFERFLHMNSNGNPRWIEACTKTLLYSGKLKIKTLSREHAVTSQMVYRCDSPSNVAHFNFFQINPVKSFFNDDMIDVAIIEGVLCQRDYPDAYKNSKLLVYDSLSSFDQMICKCASVIGASFHKSQLNYLIVKSDQRLVAKTIVKLFEFGLLFCASSIEPSQEKYCECKNNEVFESSRDLPKYANCKHMTFNDEVFRKYVYDTLTEKQRTEYHRKCIDFLCRKTKKCDSCNRRRFKSIEELCLMFRDGYIKNDCKHSDKYETTLRNVLHMEKNQCNEISRKLPIVLNFMNYEYSKCKCKFLLYHAFVDIAKHCQGKEMHMKKVFAQIVSADLSIQLGNIPNCIRFLNLTIELLHDDSNKSEDKDMLISIYMLGRVLTLQGISHEMIEQIDDALNFYYEACRTYKISFPKKTDHTTRLKKLSLLCKVRRNLCQRDRQKLTRVQSAIIHQSVFLLQNMFNFFFKTRQFELAELSALWSLKDALVSDIEMASLATCFRNILSVGIKLYLTSMQKLIFHSLFKSSSCQSIEKTSVNSVLELYIAVMEYQITKGNFQFALKIGDIGRKMCLNNGNYEAMTTIIPILFVLNIKSLQIEECFKLLQDLHYSIGMNCKTKATEIWFHALCMDLYLDAQLKCPVKYEKCLTLFNEAKSMQAYSEAHLRFFANFRLWSYQKGCSFNLTSYEFSMIENFFANGSLNLNNKFSGVKILKIFKFELKRACECGDVEYFQEIQEFMKENITNSMKYKILSNLIKK